MLQKIAEVTGIPFNQNDDITQELLARIASKLPAAAVIGHPALNAFIRKAEDDVNLEGQMAISELVKQLTAAPAEKVLKIKSSPKGARIKIAAANGVRFSFGPIWNTSVAKGKGIALVVTNRAKLNHQAAMVGVKDPEKMEAQALCAAISATF